MIKPKYKLVPIDMYFSNNNVEDHLIEGWTLYGYPVMRSDRLYQAMICEIECVDPIIEVAQTYINETFNLSESKQIDNGSTSHAHLKWMCEQIVNNPTLSRTKKSRWLGFVQGCLVKDGNLDISIERDRTRDIFKGA